MLMFNLPVYCLVEDNFRHQSFANVCVTFILICVIFVFFKKKCIFAYCCLLNSKYEPGVSHTHTLRMIWPETDAA